MRKVLYSGFQEVEIFSRHRHQLGESYAPFYDTASALNFLRKFLHSPTDMMNLRQALAEEASPGTLAGLDDQEVLLRLAHLLVEGRVKVGTPPIRPPSASSGGGAGAAVRAAPEEEKMPVAPKKKAAETEKKITVAIKAENGTDPPPIGMAVSNKIKLKGVPSEGGGSYKWSTASKRITLKDTASQTVTVEAGKSASGSPGAESIQLVFTPTDKKALSPVKHGLSVATVVFSYEASHSWGYDAYQKIACRDKDKKKSEPQPGPAIDFVSIKKGQVGKVKVSLGGAKPADVFFKSSKDAVCIPKVLQPTANPYVLEIEAKAKDKDSAEIEARIGSAAGPIVAKVGVVVLKEVFYQAELFRVKDPKSKKTALKVPFKAADLEKSLNNYYKQGVAVWSFTGGGSETEVEYDLVKNGALDLEPGITSDEEKKIIAACVSAKTRVIYIHDLRWSYYLAADTAKTDTKIKIKNYGTTNLGYIGKVNYKIVDAKGRKVTIKVKNVDTATGEVELTKAIGKKFKTADKAALIWPLGGLAGNPLWVKDVGSLSDITNFIAHELGHEVGDLLDLCEINNLMFGGGETGKKLRHRPIPKYYTPAENEEQWKTMKGR